MTRVLRDGLEGLNVVVIVVAIVKLVTGLVVKDLHSIYEPGARHWLKIKKDYLQGAADSADLVVVGAWFGSGSKGGLLSVFLMACYDPPTDRCGVGRLRSWSRSHIELVFASWLTVTKCGSGFDDATLASMQAPLKALMTPIGQDPSKLPSYLAGGASKHAPDFVALNPRLMPVWEM